MVFLEQMMIMHSINIIHCHYRFWKFKTITDAPCSCTCS